MNTTRKTRSKTLRHLKRLLTTSLACTGSVAWGAEIGCTHGIIEVDIQARDMGQAINTLAQQSGFRVVFYSDVAKDIEAPPMVGEYESCEAAVDALLSGSNLHYRVIGDKTVAIFDASSSATQGGYAGALWAANGNVALGAGKPATTEARVGGDGSGRDFKLEEEVVVTGNKRLTSLQETPLSITAFGTEDIARRSLDSMDDYLRTVPSLSFVDRGTGRNSVVVRGISADTRQEGYNNGPTVGVFLDEVPLSSVGLFGSTDIKMVDLERVEVLRGPQGTLYGSSSLAGAVRNIPNKPDASVFKGSFKGTYSQTAEKGDDNNAFEGVLNVPIIEDKLAIRAVAYYFDDSGYVQNIAGSDPDAQATAALFGSERFAVDRDNMGASEVSGGRISLLWQPIEAFDVNLTYLTQDAEQTGWLEEEVDSGDYIRVRERLSNPLDAEEGLEDNTDIASLLVNYEFDWGTLVSSSSWREADIFSAFNVGPALGVGNVPLIDEFATESLVQEVRLVSDLPGALQFIAGYYYEDVEVSQDEIITDDLLSTVFGTRVLADLLLTEDVEQNALFGELSYAFTDKFKLTLGGRYFDYDRRTGQVQSGPLSGVGLGQAAVADLKSDEQGSTFKVNADYKPNEDSLVYAQWSDGFRLGGPVVPVPASLCDVDNDGIFDGTSLDINVTETESDELEAIEIGGKFQLLDGLLILNGAIFHNTWDGIPVNVVGDCFLSLQANAGEARTQGMELEARAQLAEGLIIDVGFSLLDAEFTEDVLEVNVADGDRLPGSPEKTVNVGFEYETDIGQLPFFLRADYAYVGDFYSDVNEAGEELGDYDQVNVRAGLAIDRISVDIFANNLTNNDALTWSEVNPLPVVFRLRPRTIGMSVGYEF